MSQPSPYTNPFELVVVATLRTAQLLRGCTPRVEGASKAPVTARREVASGAIKGIRVPA